MIGHVSQSPKTRGFEIGQLLFAQRRDLRFDPRQPFNQGQTALGTQHADSGSQAIGQRAISRHHRDPTAVRKAETRAGIDDMRITSAIDFYELASITGRGNRLVSQLQKTAGDGVGIQFGDSDRPRDFSRRRLANRDVTAAVYQRPLNSMFPQTTQRLVDRVPFGNAP